MGVCLGMNEGVSSEYLMMQPKDVLVRLILSKGHFLRITERDVIFEHWNYLSRKAQKMMDTACSDMNAATAISDHKKWLIAQSDFDKAQKIYDKADKLFQSIN